MQETLLQPTARPSGSVAVVQPAAKSQQPVAVVTGVVISQEPAPAFWSYGGGLCDCSDSGTFDNVQQVLPLP